MPDWLNAYQCMEECEFGWCVPNIAYLDVCGNTAGMPSDPCLVRAEFNPNLARQLTGFPAGHPAIPEAPPVADNE
jgi:hypothetical protein